MTERFTVWVEMRRAYEAGLITMALIGGMAILIHQSSGEFSKPLQKLFEILGMLYYVFAFAFSLFSLYSLVAGR